VQYYLDAAENIPITVAPLGLDPIDPPVIQPGAPPYFVCIGTIEARKNHKLLLDLWPRLATEFGGRSPRLVLIGQRGWGSRKITDRLTNMRAAIAEYGDLPDRQMFQLLRGARALLLPSLAEGFGLPVAEALALRVPVICSDLPALRETGGDAANYLDPADAAAWHGAIVDYLADSPRRQAQITRLSAWQPPRWEDHFSIVDRLIAQLTCSRRAGEQLPPDRAG
jgi:glycosyltransferase involved in cell wall biosynthesis